MGGSRRRKVLLCPGVNGGARHRPRAGQVGAVAGPGCAWRCWRWGRFAIGARRLDGFGSAQVALPCAVARCCRLRRRCDCSRRCPCCAGIVGARHLPPVEGSAVVAAGLGRCRRPLVTAVIGTGHRAAIERGAAVGSRRGGRGCARCDGGPRTGPRLRGTETRHQHHSQAQLAECVGGHQTSKNSSPLGLQSPGTTLPARCSADCATTPTHR